MMKTLALALALMLGSSLGAKEVFNCTISGPGVPIKISLTSDEDIQVIGAESLLVAQGMLRSEFTLETIGSQNTTELFILDFLTTARGLDDQGNLIDLVIPGHLELARDQHSGEFSGTGELRLENTFRTLSPRLRHFYQLGQCSGPVADF